MSLMKLYQHPIYFNDLQEAQWQAFQEAHPGIKFSTYMRGLFAEAMRQEETACATSAR